MEPVDDLIVRALRGEAVTWPNDASGLEELAQRCAVHGVGPLVFEKLGPDAPVSVRNTLREAVLWFAGWELQHERVLREVTAAFTREGIPMVFIKGTPLAFSVYRDPALRVRGDTDIVIPAQDRDRVDRLLASLGFETPNAVEGTYASYQRTWLRADASGFRHALDIHWKINNSEVLSRLFTFEELAAAAQPVTPLGPGARAAAPVHALLLACMHRATHRQNPYWVNGVAQYGDRRLIWLCDIDLLARSFDAPAWDDFVTQAKAKGLANVCADAFADAALAFATPFPAMLPSRLREARGELPARYLDASKPRQQWMDFVALGNAGSRARFLREVLFPQAEYMRGKYAGSTAPLPWLYVRRIAAGLHRTIAGREPAGQ